MQELIIGGIETYGCDVVHVEPTDGKPGWCYTIGLYDTCGKPEVIAIGLQEQMAHHLLNEATRRLRNGVDLAQDRQPEMLARWDCEFRTFDPKWIKPYMGGAVWYYGRSKFPVLQAACSYRESRLREDARSDQWPQELLLQTSLLNWKFPDPPNKLVFLSEGVYSGLEPITHVSHDASDGAWEFLGDSMLGEREPVVVCFNHVIEADPTLQELADLPSGWWAERAKPGDCWKRRKHRSGYHG